MAYAIFETNDGQKMEEDRYFDDIKLAERLINCANSYKAIGETDKANSLSSSSSSSASCDQRNGFVSFVFGLVCGAGVLLTSIWFHRLITGNSTSGGLEFLVFLASGIAGIIIAASALRNKRNILFIIILLLCIPSWLSIFGLVPNSLKSSFEKATAQETATEQKVE